MAASPSASSLISPAHINMCAASIRGWWAPSSSSDTGFHLFHLNARRLDDLAVDNGVFVEPVHRAHAMITIGNDHFAIERIAHQQQGAQRLALANAHAILFHVIVAGA